MGLSNSNNLINKWTLLLSSCCWITCIAAALLNLSWFDWCEDLGAGGGVGWAEGGAGGVAACLGAGVGVTDFGTTSGVIGEGAGLLDVNTPF